MFVGYGLSGYGVMWNDVRYGSGLKQKATEILFCAEVGESGYRRTQTKACMSRPDHFHLTSLTSRGLPHW